MSYNASALQPNVTDSVTQLLAEHPDADLCTSFLMIRVWAQDQCVIKEQLSALLALAPFARSCLQHAFRLFPFAACLQQKCCEDVSMHLPSNVLSK